ncbi:MAG: hypothetical protein M3Y27_30440 [Acidobacteriota bacterium]|nr:hypothetical protein [Acidobacteriota bacterium]
MPENVTVTYSGLFIQAEDPDGVRDASSTLAPMAADFAPVFGVLKPVLAKFANRLSVKADTPTEYTLLTKSASPFPQHEGQPLYFGSVRLGKAYVSFHLMPLYMCPELMKAISPALKKRMQGKTCFNFKSDPGPELIADLKQLTETSVNRWSERKWL